MKKFTFIFSFLAVTLILSAQKITFEDNTLNGAAVVYGGTASLVSNPAKTGINASNYCLDIVDDGYAPVKFSNFNISTGSKSAYPYVMLKFKVAYKGYNGGTDLDYPQVDVFSSAESPTLGAEEKLGTTSSAWGTHASDSLVWKSVSFTFSTSALATIPNGMLVLKLAKQKCEYLLDDIELIPSPVFNLNIFTIEDFESKTVGDAGNYVLYWSDTSAATGTCVIAADPSSTTNSNTSSTKALQITPAGYNGTALFNVTLPAGSTLDQYDLLYYDVYFANAIYAQDYVSANGTIVAQTTSGYPSQGTAGVWNTKTVALSGLAATNTFAVKVGLTSNNSNAYFLDNIKLHKNEGTTGFEKTENAKPWVIYLSGNVYKMNLTVNLLSITDLNGRNISKMENVSEFDASGLKSGLYIVKATIDGTNYATKIIR